MAWQNEYFDNLSSLGKVKGNLGDFAHASATFLRNNHRLAPKFKFLFHVNFSINPQALVGLNDYLKVTEFNLLVESAQLPSFTLDTETLNMYNKKRIVQTKINYEPVEIVFHDDMAGLTSLLWETYYRYYFQDGTYTSLNSDGSTNNNPRAYQNNPVRNIPRSFNYRYGLDKGNNTPNVPFFNSITINQLHTIDTNRKHTSITLLNPMIQTFSHDRVEYGANDFMKNTMRVEYESVIYGRNDTREDSPSGFANIAHYDKQPSPLGTSAPGNGLDLSWSILFNGQSVDSNFFFLNNRLQITDRLELPNVDNIASDPEGNNLINDIISTLVFGVTNNSFPTNQNGQTEINAQVYQTALIENSNNNRAQRYVQLLSNQQLLDDTSFATVYREELLADGFSGDFNSQKASWDSLSRSAKNTYNQKVLNAL